MADQDQIAVQDVRAALLMVLEEAFVQVHGIFLDPNNTFFDTLATVSSAEASRPVGGGCASIAAQVNHTRFYLEVALKYARGENPGPQDWDASWNVGAVSNREWQGLIQGLRDAYEAIRDFISTCHTWNAEMIGGAIGAIAHCAYHLGEIRQGLCVIKGNRTKAA